MTEKDNQENQGMTRQEFFRTAGKALVGTTMGGIAISSRIPAALAKGTSRPHKDMNADWPLAKPEEMGLDGNILNGPLQELMGANKTGASALVVKGKLVWEYYWDGFGPSSRFDVYSAGKAYAAAAIGLLMDDGKIKIDDPACRILTEWAGDERREITIRHLLTMTSGLKLDYEGFKVLADPTAATLAWPLERQPGTVWCYEQATAQALCPIILRLTGKQPIVFLRERLLNQIGAVETDWLRSRKGDCLTWRSVLASARDFCRFGQFFLQNGQWNRRQLLSRKFIQQAIVNDPLLQRVTTDPRQQDFRRRGYGWLMFVNTNRIWEGVDPRGYGFLGAFHNICLVDPANDMVFVRLVTPEDQSHHEQYENALDITDKGTAQLWRLVLSAFPRR